jgi:dTDP-4-amino-4,6-dideoxygalactose transaminase
VNDKNYHLALIVQDDSLIYRKVYVRKDKGRDWQMVWIETGHWLAVNYKREQVRLNEGFRRLERSKPILAGRVRNFFTKWC